MSKMLMQPYLFFNGRCEEAVDFYCSALDAKVEMVMRYRESPEPAADQSLPQGWDDKIMHAAIYVGDLLLMMSDGCDTDGTFSGFSLALSLKSPADVDRYFNALSKGGKVTMPLAKTFWSPRFGMLTDRFGVSWMLMADPAK